MKLFFPEGKGGKCLEKENIFLGEEKRGRKRRKILGEGKYIFLEEKKKEKGKEENIWRKKKRKFWTRNFIGG